MNLKKANYVVQQAGPGSVTLDSINGKFKNAQNAQNAPSHGNTLVRVRIIQLCKCFKKLNHSFGKTTQVVVVE